MPCSHCRSVDHETASCELLPTREGLQRAIDAIDIASHQLSHSAIDESLVHEADREFHAIIQASHFQRTPASASNCLCRLSGSALMEGLSCHLARPDARKMQARHSTHAEPSSYRWPIPTG